MEDLFSRYLKKLFTQYKESLGDKNLNFEDPSVIISFYNWLQEYRGLLEKYRLFLNKYGIINSSNFTVEIGKGFLDTILKEKEHIILITPFATIFDNSKPRSIINGRLNFEENIPILESLHTPTGLILSNVSYFFTQNPYNKKETVLKLVDIHNQKHDVCLGMFGKKKDQDMDMKMECLEKFSTEVGGKLQTSSLEDAYLGLVYTNDNKKTF